MSPEAQRGSKRQSPFRLFERNAHTVNPAKVVVAFVLVVISSVAFSQASGPQSVETRGSGGASLQPTQADPCAAKAKTEQGQVDVLSDTQGLDFGPYLRQVVHTVRDSWYSTIPRSANPPTDKQGRVAIKFAIKSDGTITGEEVEVSSGDATLDQTAFRGISALQFDPLPKGYSGEQLSLRFKFYYNLVPDTSKLFVSPCDVRVPVRSTLQFSVPIGGIERAAVKWRSLWACVSAVRLRDSVGKWVVHGTNESARSPNSFCCGNAAQPEKFSSENSADGRIRSALVTRSAATSSTLLLAVYKS